METVVQALAHTNPQTESMLPGSTTPTPSYSPARFTPSIAPAAVVDPTLHVTGSTPTGQAATASAPPDTEVETKLTAEIAKLWGQQKDGNAKVKRTRAELKLLQLALSEKLYAMKATLVGTGRGGSWAAYLRSLNLPLASADRYVEKHEATLASTENKLLSEELNETQVDKVRQLAQKLLPRLSRILISQALVYEFVHELVWNIDAAEGALTQAGLEIPRVSQEDTGEEEDQAAELASPAPALL